MATKKDKWTEIEHLPAWDEEFYDVYTGKKFGKWVMFKTLKEAYRDDPRFQAMIEKEFDVRYNLSHPNIIMINDFEEIADLGMCIVTDDVYGKPLSQYIADNAVTPHHIDQIKTRLIDAIDYIQRNHIVHAPIRPETIIFTENIENLKLIDVGFDQHSHLTPAEASEDILNFGRVLEAALDAAPDFQDPHLRRIAEKCLAEDPAGRYRSLHELRLAIDRRTDRRLYGVITVFLVIMIALIVWLLSGHGPKPIQPAHSQAAAPAAAKVFNISNHPITYIHNEH